MSASCQRTVEACCTSVSRLLAAPAYSQWGCGHLSLLRSSSRSLRGRTGLVRTAHLDMHTLQVWYCLAQLKHRPQWRHGMYAHVAGCCLHCRHGWEEGKECVAALCTPALAADVRNAPVDMPINSMSLPSSELQISSTSCEAGGGLEAVSMPAKNSASSSRAFVDFHTAIFAGVTGSESSEGLAGMLGCAPAASSASTMSRLPAYAASHTAFAPSCGSKRRTTESACNVSVGIFGVVGRAAGEIW